MVSVRFFLTAPANGDSKIMVRYAILHQGLIESFESAFETKQRVFYTQCQNELVQHLLSDVCAPPSKPFVFIHAANPIPILKYIRRNPVLRPLVVVVLNTRDADEMLAYKAYQYGASSYIECAEEPLNSTIEQVLNYWLNLAQLPTRQDFSS